MIAPQITPFALNDAPTEDRRTTRDDQLTLALEQYAAAIDAGHPLSKDELLAKFSDVADELRGCLDSLDFIRQVAPQLDNKAGISFVPSQADDPVVGPNHPSPPRFAGEGPGKGRATLGDFRIVHELGRGGMGVVYEAEQLSLGRRVALKVLPFAAMLDRQQLNRFKNEARAAATLDHPNIVAIYSVGVERGVHYYAMQLIEGQSLAQVVEQLRSEARGARRETGLSPPHLDGEGLGEGCRDTAPIAHLPTQLDPRSSLLNPSARDYYRTIAQLGIQAAEALDHAHQNGILHRDIKPANLLVECSHLAPRDGLSDPKVWITDFGLARIEQDAGMTMTGDLLGTLRYMSPEQALAKRVVVDYRSDIYSLGVTLYELLTLQPAFAGGDRQELLRQIAFEEPRKPRQINSRIPQDLETIVLKAIEKNPADRYPTAQQLAEDLRRFLDDQTIRAKPPSLLQRARKWSRRHRALVASTALSVAILVLTAIAALIYSNLMIARERNEKSVALAARTAALQEKTAALDRADRNFQMVLTVIERSLASVGDQTLANVPQLEQLRKKLLEDAIEFYEKLLKENPDDLSVRFATARVYVRVAMIHHDFLQWDDAIRLNEKAIVVLEDLIDTDPVEASYRFELATAYKQRAWNAMTEDPSTETSHWARRAVELFQDLQTDFPHDATYNSSLLEGLLTLDYWSMTFAERESLIARMAPICGLPQVNRRFHGSFKQTIASHHSANGRLDEAEVNYREAVRLHNENVDAHPAEGLARTHLVRARNDLGNLLIKRGKIEEAIECFGESFEIGMSLRQDFPSTKHYDEFSVRALVTLVKCLEDQGRTDEANEKLSEWDVSDYADYDLRGYVYCLTKQFDKAARDFSEAIRLAPKSPGLRATRGKVYHKLRRYQEAIDDFDVALKLQPDFSPALIGKAWTLATASDKTIRIDKLALEMAKEACELTEFKNAQAVSTLAAAYAESGDFRRAIEWSRKAMKLTVEGSEQQKEYARHLENYEASRPWHARNTKDDSATSL